MTQELFYTSAPRGLQPGSTGFCTVAETRALSPLLRERLEDLSGYREMFPPHDARAGQNPVAWSHSRFTIQGKSVSVLSRVGAAGVDHSQRTNKFAHHVVIDAQEQNQAGPAALLARPGFMDIVWDGKVRTLPAGRPVPAFDVKPAPCAGWLRATGDAGWAGALVDAFLNNRTAYILYPLGMEILPLLGEALALLPPERRWQVTFSTYFTVLPSGSPCAWRCVPLESAGAAEALRAPGALVIRLEQAQGSAPAGPAMDAARTGSTIAVAPANPQPAGVMPSGRTQAPPREAVPRQAPAVSPGIRQESPRHDEIRQEPQSIAAADGPGPYVGMVEMAPVRPRASLFGGFAAGVVVGVVGVLLLGLGLWLGVGLRPIEAPPPAAANDGREAEITKKVEEARKHWEEKELPAAVERGRKERGDELRKDVQVARACREVIPSVLGEIDAATLEDQAALKKKFTDQVNALKAPEDRKAARNSREILPQIFPKFDISTLADSDKFKAELARALKATREDAVKNLGSEQAATINKMLPVLQFYFDLDDQAITGATPEQVQEKVQKRYEDLLKNEVRAETELENAVKARDSYKRFLHDRMENWRTAVKNKVRSKEDLTQEADEMRKRFAIEQRPDKDDPRINRSVTFQYSTTWILDYFDTVEHSKFVLKYSRRDDKRKRAEELKKEVIDLRQAALDELDRYLTPGPK